MHEQEEIVRETHNHCKAIDNYLDKYQPVRVQAMIGDTLNACLTGEPRRSHELYDSDKLSLLYRLILEDDGTGNSIQKLVFELNEKAKNKISEEEKAQRRKAQAMADADALK